MAIIRNVHDILLDKDTYKNNTSMRSINLRNTAWVYETMEGAFSGCTNLVSVSLINSNVTSMEGTFNGCSSLTTLTNLPDSLTNLTNAFNGCSSLLTIPEIPNTVLSLVGTFTGCSSMQATPTLSNTVTNLNNTFKNCSSLTSVTNIPSNVTNMNGTFDGCTNLTTVPIIPQTVTSMNKTFNNCSSISGRIYIYSPDITDATNCFNNSGPSNKYVYIPFSSEGTSTTTLNSFLTAGYDSLGTLDHVYLRDIAASACVLTINPSPSDATVILTASGYEQEGNTITVDQGTSVTYTVSKPGYITETNTITVNSTQTLPVSLTEITYTLTVTPVPSDAIVKLEASGYTMVQGSGVQSISVRPNTTVTYTVSKSGYDTETDDVVVTQDPQSLTVSLTGQMATLQLTVSETGGTGQITAKTYYTSSLGSFIDGPELMLNKQMQAPVGDTIYWVVRTDDNKFTAGGSNTLSAGVNTTSTSARENKLLTLNYTPIDATITVTDCTGYVVTPKSTSPGQNIYYMPWWGGGGGQGLNTTVSITGSAPHYTTKTITATRSGYNTDTTATLNLELDSEPILVTSNTTKTLEAGTYKAILISAGGNGDKGTQAAVSGSGAPGGGGGGSGKVSIISFITDGESVTFNPATSASGTTSISCSTLGLIGSIDGGSSASGANGGNGGSGGGSGGNSVAGGSAVDGGSGGIGGHDGYNGSGTAGTGVNGTSTGESANNGATASTYSLGNGGSYGKGAISIQSTLMSVSGFKSATVDSILAAMAGGGAGSGGRSNRAATLTGGAGAGGGGWFNGTSGTSGQPSEQSAGTGGAGAIIYMLTELPLSFVTLTINPDPVDAIVTLTATGYTQQENSITVPYGTNVSYIVSKEGYQSKSETITITANIIKSIVLQEEPYTPGEVLFESNTPGTYTFTPQVPCVVQIDAVGGGGGGGSAHASSSVSWTDTYAAYGVGGGGSGNYNSGEYNLSAIEYQIVVGNKGSGNTSAGGGGDHSATGGTGGTTSFGSLISATGGTGGYGFAHAVGNGTSSDSRAGVGYRNGERYNTNGSIGSYRSFSISGGAGWNNYGIGGGASSGDPVNSNWANDGTPGYIKVTFLRYS